MLDFLGGVIWLKISEEVPSREVQLDNIGSLRAASTGVGRRSVKWLPILAFALMLLFPAPASANRSVVANDSITNYTNFGTVGWSYTMADPRIAPGGFHLNSVYVESSVHAFAGSPPEMAELGWVWNSTYNAPRYFWAFVNNGVYYGGPNGIYGTPIPAPGSTHAYKLAVSTPGSTVYHWVVDGNDLGHATISFSAGQSLMSSEMYSYSDRSNYAHFLGPTKQATRQYLPVLAKTRAASLV